MTHVLRDEDLSFIERAPIRVSAERSIAAPAADIWPLVVEAEEWPRWFGGMKEARATSEGPPRAGSTRYVEVGPTKANEVLLAVEAPRLYAFRLTDANLRFLAAVVERVTLDEQDGSTVVRYEQGAELSSWYGWMSPLLQRQLGKALNGALDGLAGLVEGDVRSG